MNHSGNRDSGIGSASNPGATPFTFPFWTHCNVCKAFPIRGGQGEDDGETASFVVSNCGHVFCGSCGDALQSSTCPFCHVQVSLLPINENMPAEAKSFFLGETSLKKSVQYSKSLNRHLENLTRVHQYEQNQTAYLMHSASQMKRRVDSLEEEKERLEESIETLRREKEDLQRRGNSPSGSPVPANNEGFALGLAQFGNGPNRNPTTPMCMTTNASPASSTTVSMSPPRTNNHQLALVSRAQVPVPWAPRAANQQYSASGSQTQSRIRLPPMVGSARRELLNRAERTPPRQIGQRASIMPPTSILRRVDLGGRQPLSNLTSQLRQRSSGAASSVASSGLGSNVSSGCSGYYTPPEYPSPPTRFSHQRR